MLECKDLCFSYEPRKDVLKDVSFSLKEGSFTALLGKNGCGKSTLMKVMASLLKAKKGEVLYDKENLLTMKEKERSRILSYCPQKISENSLTVYDTILLGRLPYLSSHPKKEDYLITEEVIKELKLEELALKNFRQISIGQQQIVTLARVLSTRSKIILLDEPTSALDIARQIEICQILSKEAKKENKIILASLHDINLAMEFSDNFLLMKEGSLICFGGKEIITKENLSLVYETDISLEETKNGKHIIYKKGTDYEI